METLETVERTFVSSVTYERVVNTTNGAVRLGAVATLSVGYKPGEAVANLVAFVDSEISKALANPAAVSTAPLPAAAASDSEQRTFVATSVRKSADEKTGEVRIRLVGHPFAQFGVPVYPEKFAELGIDPDVLRFGESPLPREMPVIIEMQPSSKDPSKMSAQRVVSLIGTPSPKPQPSGGRPAPAQPPLQTDPPIAPSAGVRKLMAELGVGDEIVLWQIKHDHNKNAIDDLDANEAWAVCQWLREACSKKLRP